MVTSTCRFSLRWLTESSVRTMASVRKMSNLMEPSSVVHDHHNMEFYIKLGRNKAFLQYDIMDTATKAVDLQHTVVPEAFRGQGIGKVLAKAAFEHFIANNQQMKLTCWYLKKYYQENPLPQYQEKVLME
ncbi:protein NATD1-like [Homarus americanus]|uniref:NATD1-like n=1 Tax=Homarus americanus TaxID=6706 RepID=A0A8J5NAI7_HOMAM|nr:protein NATD1-like [Homarus americanus]KAG7175793.1 NATD1-like [Homarus americanus]